MLLHLLGPDPPCVLVDEIGTPKSALPSPALQHRLPRALVPGTWWQRPAGMASTFH